MSITKQTRLVSSLSQPTKPLGTQRDLSLAYSPGVAFACEEIVKDPAAAARLTARANLVAVITNGFAALGLGNIGPLASKPVMEGKAVLFKKFAGIDVFDIELDAKDPDRFVEAVAALEPTFGAINLEDIKAPECFEIERKLRDRVRIPLMHDDQHGTAIVVAAAILNGLKVVGKDIRNVKLACCGGGAAALACLDLLVSLGLSREHIMVTDRVGVVYEGRTEEMNLTWPAMRVQHICGAWARRWLMRIFSWACPRLASSRATWSKPWRLVRSSWCLRIPRLKLCRRR